MQHPRTFVRRRETATANTAAATGPGRTHVKIADHNLRVTLEAIRREGPLTRLELARRSGLTAPAITNILRRLLADGLVTEHRRAERLSGQPSMEFALNPDGAFSVGLRLRGAESQAVLIDLGGHVRDTSAFDAGDDLVAAIHALLRRFRAGPALPRSIVGVGLVTDAPGSLEVAALTAALAPLRLMVERDTVAAVLAERTLGLGVVDGGLVLIIIDETIRAGLLLHGAPFAGVHGQAGKIGAMRTGTDRVRLDSVVSLAALRPLLGAEDYARVARGIDLPITPALEAWIKSAAGHLLDAIVAMAGFVAPGTIVIGGDLPRNIIQAIIAQMGVESGDTARRPFATPWMSPIRPATFAGAGIAVGAALLPFFELLLPAPAATADR